MKKVIPRQIDPEKVAYQLDKLIAAIWGVAEDEIAEEMKATKRSARESSGQLPLTVPLTLNSKTR